LFEKQHKAEDGTISMGLGNKAGGCLNLFNDSVAKRFPSWRIVKVKRRKKIKISLTAVDLFRTHDFRLRYLQK